MQSYVEFNLASRLGSLRGSEDPEPDIHPSLTDREREIVQLVCRGATNVQIARRLNIAVATVKTHLIHVFEKCKVETRTGLVSQVLSAGARLDH